VVEWICLGAKKVVEVATTKKFNSVCILHARRTV
jgi:hypothetical protein